MLELLSNDDIQGVEFQSLLWDSKLHLSTLSLSLGEVDVAKRLIYPDGREFVWPFRALTDHSLL